MSCRHKTIVSLVNEMNSETYHWYKEHGICTHCRHGKAVEGKTLCLVCLMDNRQYKKPYDKDKCKERDTTRYAYRKENGLCVTCGKEKQQHGLKCNRCYAKYRSKQIARQTHILRSERVSFGLCYDCGKPKMADKGLCKDCYNKKYASISKIMYGPVSDYWKNDENNRHRGITQ